MFSAALTATFAIFVAARATALWLVVARVNTVTPDLLEQAIAFTAVALLVGFEACLLALGRLREHSIERLTFHVTLLTLTLVACGLELSGKSPEDMARYLQDHSLHLGVEAGIGARSLLHSARGILLFAAASGITVTRLVATIGLALVVVTAAIGSLWPTPTSGGQPKPVPPKNAAVESPKPEPDINRAPLRPHAEGAGR
jgi:hypothetical protein